MSYYQCTKCGVIISFDKKLKLEDDIYSNLPCEKCGNKYSLYLCDNLDDIYIYADSFLDSRYFDYSK